ncbi:MAG: MmgE/PrpD family protein, partial [Desulfosarcina sp.]|nr:MmgE/PrpD family protein [Desulfosarcina sp.]
DPDTLEGAQYSLPFCLAVAACGGAEALLPLSPEWLHRPEVTTLAAQVRMHVDPPLEACFPAETSARVCLETTAGRFEQTVRYPLGDPANPMDRTRLISKFRRLAAGLMTPTDQDRILLAIEGLQDLENVEPILSCLRKPEVGDPVI